MKEAMVQSGFGIGSYRASIRNNIAAFIELHVEQVMVLERTGAQIGIVETIAGQKRFTVEVIGEANHAGTTPMSWRADALAGASNMIQKLQFLAKQAGSPMVATVGRLMIEPNIVNVIPGKAVFSVDVRHTDDYKLEAFCQTFADKFVEIARDHKLQMDINCWMNGKSVHMDETLSRKLQSKYSMS